MNASEVVLTPPAEATSLSVSLGDNVAMDHCGPGDPGSVVYMSPVEPSYLATFTSP